MKIARLIALSLTLACLTCCDSKPEHEAEVELAPFMSRLQLFSQKLGYSIKAENGPLAKFYLHELHEIFEEIEHDVPEHDGFPIAKLVKATVEPSLEALSQALNDQQVSWKQRWHSYEATISSCNACHTATAHAFIHILPAKGASVFNQQFTRQLAAPPK